MRRRLSVNIGSLSFIFRKEKEKCLERKKRREKRKKRENL